jgi:hypothetical protein
MKIIKFFPDHYVLPAHYTEQISKRKWDDAIRELISNELSATPKDTNNEPIDNSELIDITLNEVAWIVETEDGTEIAYFLAGSTLYITVALMAHRYPGITPGTIIWSKKY